MRTNVALVTETIRLILVEDHAMVLDGLISVMASEPDLELVGTASSVADASALIGSERPAVVITDFALPDGTGADVAEFALKTDSSIKVLMITGLNDRTAVRAAIRAGCSGFMSKGEGIAQLRSAVRAVAGGATVFPANLLAAVAHSTISGVGNDLTKRELEILGGLAKAKSAEDLADEYVLSLHTVRNHIQNVLSKLGARSQLEAVVTAAAEGLVQVGITE